MTNLKYYRTKKGLDQPGISSESVPRCGDRAFENTRRCKARYNRPVSPYRAVAAVTRQIIPQKRKAPYSAFSALYGALFKNTDKKKGAPPGGTNKPGGDMNISKSDIQGHYYYITSQTICQAPRKKTPDRSRAFSPKGVKQESHTVKGNRPATAHYGAAWQKNYWRLPNPYVSKYIIPHIRRNVKR